MPTQNDITITQFATDVNILLDGIFILENQTEWKEKLIDLIKKEKRNLVVCTNLNDFFETKFEKDSFVLVPIQSSKSITIKESELMFSKTRGKLKLIFVLSEEALTTFDFLDSMHWFRFTKII